MRLGFSLFKALNGKDHVYEVFPSASYKCFEDQGSPEVLIELSQFRPGPKDMIDACAAALTVREYMEGRGCEVGGGDGLGSIILPLPLKVPDTHPVLHWPESA